MDKLKKFGPLFIITAALLWSFDGVLRRSLYSLPPAIVVFWEHILGLIVLFPFIINRTQELKKMTRKEWIAIAVVGLFSGALGTILYTAALGKVNYIQFSVVVLLQQLQPIWAILTAAILLKEKITKKFFIWGAIAIIGSYFVSFKDLRLNISLNNATFVAALMAVAAGMMWAASTSFSKIVLNKVSFITATFLRFLFAPIFAFIIIAFFNQSSLILNLKSNQWMTLIVIMLSTGMVALLIYYYGLKKTLAKNSAIYELVWPVSAIFIDYFYYHNTFSLTQIIGVIAVLFSIYKITSLKENKIYNAKVLKGTQDGRKIGFPTVNLEPDIFPSNYKKGVYSAKVHYENKIYPGALYYGPRKVKDETHPVLEIHMIDFDDEIYGKDIKFEILNFIRETQDFKSMKELKTQLALDIKEIKKANN